ncbi:hypothetical protein [Chondrinema litorale]|uniref:hypothetical protein n=1 Tax=Chondrinema litorale TaxID=2994555 RepID=UPI0025432CEB|nr:hypothetical protein [Chondrinema litorale]UZR98860.1 hypothetical protein OQ292_33245 [Chondrinema litorale]
MFQIYPLPDRKVLVLEAWSFTTTIKLAARLSLQSFILFAILFVIVSITMEVKDEKGSLSEILFAYAIMAIGMSIAILIYSIVKYLLGKVIKTKIEISGNTISKSTSIFGFNTQKVSKPFTGFVLKESWNRYQKRISAIYGMGYTDDLTIAVFNTNKTNASSAEMIVKRLNTVFELEEVL